MITLGFPCFFCNIYKPKSGSVRDSGNHLRFRSVSFGTSDEQEEKIMGEIKDFNCTYDNSAGISSAVTEGLGLTFPEAYLHWDTMDL